MYNVTWNGDQVVISESTSSKLVFAGGKEDYILTKDGFGGAQATQVKEYTRDGDLLAALAQRITIS